MALLLAEMKAGCAAEHPRLSRLRVPDQERIERRVKRRDTGPPLSALMEL
jgi:hypothetical protein